MPEEPDPPRKFYGFKPREFPRANALPGDPVDPADPAAAGPGPIDVRTLAREANAWRPGSGPRPVAPENEIHTVLRENLARADAAGLNEVAPRPRRSRRRRDYFCTLALGNTVLLGATWIMPIFGIAGLILFNVGVTWIMWFVMDDY